VERHSMIVPLGTGTCAFIQEKSHTRATTVVADSGPTTTSSATRRNVRTGTLAQSSPLRHRRARAWCRAWCTDNAEQQPAWCTDNAEPVQLQTLANRAKKAHRPDLKSQPVNQTSEAAKALMFSLAVVSFGVAAKIKIVSRPNTRLVISYVATIYLTPQSRYGKAKSRKQETAILIFFRGLQKVASKLAPVFGTKRISSRNIF